MSDAPIRLGTRRSALATAQSQQVADALAAASESLTFNPRGRSLRTQVAALRDDLDVFTPI
ncbi:hypothetical protein ABTN41_19205, partial [Acinetobacter baumannii]